jgi:hypothetical protein
VDRRQPRSGFWVTFLDSSHPIFALAGAVRVSNTFTRDRKRMSGMDTTPETNSKAFVVTCNRHILPKERRIERLPTGYSIQECRNDPRGHYWFVITALEVLRRPARI